MIVWLIDLVSFMLVNLVYDIFNIVSGNDLFIFFKFEIMYIWFLFV